MQIVPVQQHKIDITLMQSIREQTVSVFTEDALPPSFITCITEIVTYLRSQALFLLCLLPVNRLQSKAWQESENVSTTSNEMDTDTLLNLYDEETERVVGCTEERALYRLLHAHKHQIRGLIEHDESGFWFHKSFRQADITGSADIDMAIWLLLKKAPIFWKILDRHSQA